MSDIAIRAEGLGKRYRLGELHEQSAFRRAFAMPFRWLTRQSRGQEYLWALKDVDFQVNRGEILGVIGPNGAGKSTLLKVLSRITTPTTGRAEIFGRVGSLLEVGTGFHPELTGRENVFLNGVILGMPRREVQNKFDQIVAFSGIEEFLDTPVKRYSSGMYVRLAFAVAAHLDPDVLIIDEVLAVGDVEFQRRCLERMNDTARDGRTVLFVSHNTGAVQRLCSRAIVLARGGIDFDGPVEDAIEHYLSAYGAPEHGHADLSEHPGRASGMIPILREITLTGKDSADSSRSSFESGEDVTFEIKYDTGSEEFNYAVIGICSHLGERVATLHSRHGDDLSGPIRGAGKLRCTVPNLPLGPGVYRLLVAVGRGTPPKNIDLVENAMTFHVELGRFFDGPVGLMPSQGPLAQKSIWAKE